MLSDYDFVAHVTSFCRALRSYGLLIGPAETADAVRALALVDIMDRGRVYWALRCLLVSRREEARVFDELFEKFWDFGPLPTARASALVQGDGTRGGMRHLRRAPSGVLLPQEDHASENSLVQVVRSGASPNSVVSRKDLTILKADELAELAQVAARMVRALASRPGRRRRRHRRKGTPDVRGALRLSLNTGGDPIRLPRRRRVPRVPRLLVLLDVSGSMDRHVRLLLQLVYAVSQHTKRVETFVFSTSVTRVTRQLKAPSFAEALERVGAVVDHWSSGTRIGESVAQVNADYEALEDRYTTVFLLSDGWETGDPEALAREMRRLRQRVARVVWLNPLLGTQDYQPLARGLQAVAPYVDCFAPATDVAHLKRLPQLLRA